jgi:hypothetical protein
MYQILDIFFVNTSRVKVALNLTRVTHFQMHNFTDISVVCELLEIKCQFWIGLKVLKESLIKFAEISLNMSISNGSLRSSSPPSNDWDCLVLLVLSEAIACFRVWVWFCMY